MGFNTFPCNPYPISTEELNKGNNDDLNTRVATLESDVSDLNSNKANQITIAPFFNAETAYTAGDLVYYNGLTYRCTNDHEGEWDADDFAATTISNELDSLKNGLNDLGSVITPTVGTNITLLNGGYTVIGNMVCVNLSISTAEVIPFNTLIATIVSPAISETPISIYNINTFDIVPKGRVYVNGNIVASEPLDASARYIIVGCYIKAS